MDWRRVAGDDEALAVIEFAKALVERYETNTMKYSIMGDTPRKAYRRTAEVLLGKKVWELINEEYGAKWPGLALDSLVDHENVPWEELINTGRPEVRDAVLKFAEAIEPEMRDYLDALVHNSLRGPGNQPS